MAKQYNKRDIPKKSENISDWYTSLIMQAELADYGPVRGTMVIRPYGYAIWEAMEEYLDRKFKEHGVQNAFFPTFIPMHLLQKEKEHVQGFSPELAVVTHGGGEKLAEPLVVRPTSETIMYESYSRWIQSYRDLPLKLNLWNSVVRWEKRTFLFFRTLEFLWQEGHTAHATAQEADEFARTILDIYKVFDEKILAIPVVIGQKSQSEKFAGAYKTYSLEALMPDGKALQIGTSHNLGDNFAKAFDITYLDKDNSRKHVHQTSWAETTRAVGGLIMTHGDDNGLIFPPQIAPTQVVIIAITDKQEHDARDIGTRLSQKGFRVTIDANFDKSIGHRINYWELRGVPIRIEIGAREVSEKKVVCARRDTFEKQSVSLTDLESVVESLLTDIQQTLFDRAEENMTNNTHKVTTYDEFKKIMNTTRGFIIAYWCESGKCEEKIKEETKATTRVKPLNASKENGRCIYCGSKASYQWYFAQAY